LIISYDKTHWDRNHFQKILFQIELVRDDLEDEKLQISRKNITKQVAELVKLGEEHMALLHNLATDHELPKEIPELKI